MAQSSLILCSLGLMTARRSRSIFLKRVGEALSPYQLVEASLKIYVARAHMRIEKLIRDKIPFNYPITEFENAPLERLISLFQRYSNNKALITRLRKAATDRNYIAHRVIEEVHGTSPGRSEYSSNHIEETKETRKRRI